MAAGFTRMWLPLYERLSQSVDLIAPEHPGFGETEMPEWLDGFDDLVIHYDSLLDALGLDRVHVVGYSLGGWIAAELAVFHPRRLASLTLITPIGLRIPGKPIGDLFAMDPEVVRHDDLQRSRPTPRRSRPTSRASTRSSTSSGRWRRVARLAWNPRYDPKLERRLARVTCPALVVRAEHDRLVPDEIAERYAELIAGARIETVPGTGHALIVEQPEKTADVISTFIQEHDS